jgi:hypothetical protein
MAIVYPRPPPTCNNLTPAQRTQLLRSNAKLGQVLGSTPHVLDEINGKSGGCGPAGIIRFDEILFKFIDPTYPYTSVSFLLRAVCCSYCTKCFFFFF